MNNAYYSLYLDYLKGSDEDYEADPESGVIEIDKDETTKVLVKLQDVQINKNGKIEHAGNMLLLMILALPVPAEQCGTHFFLGKFEVNLEEDSATITLKDVHFSAGVTGQEISQLVDQQTFLVRDFFSRAFSQTLMLKL